jgi:single-strand DNA-binding protein
MAKFKAVRDFNQVSIMGRLVADAEPVGNESQGMELRIASHNAHTNAQGVWTEDQTTFVSCVMWGPRAQALVDHLTKGRKVLVTGRLMMDAWKDKETQEARSKLYIGVSDLQFLDAPKQEDEEEKVAAPAKATPSQATLDGMVAAAVAKLLGAAKGATTTPPKGKGKRTQQAPVQTAGFSEGDVPF